MLDFDGPTGERITLSQLPPRGHKGLSVQDKILVVAAVRNGMLTFFEACEWYGLSLESFWTGSGLSTRFGPLAAIEIACNRPSFWRWSCRLGDG